MQYKTIRIGTRGSQLAVWQAQLVKNLLEQTGHTAELVFIKSEGDIDLVTPLYAMGVQGVFTRSLDAALLSDKIDVAVHSMKDVPVQLSQGIAQAAVLKRANYKDLLVCHPNRKIENPFSENWLTALHEQSSLTIATSSIRRCAQWLHRYPRTTIQNLRGNVNTRLDKIAKSNWAGVIFAAAGLERIHERPANSIELDWMLPAPAQGAIMVVARTEDAPNLRACATLNDTDTNICTKIERDFLSALMGGCATPISALAQIERGEIIFKGNILSPDGKQKAAVEQSFSLSRAENVGGMCATELLKNGGENILHDLKNK